LFLKYLFYFWNSNTMKVAYSLVHMHRIDAPFLLPETEKY